MELLAKRLGKDRTTIANALRLLKLPERVRQYVIDRRLTEGHARALLGAKDAAAIEPLMMSQSLGLVVMMSPVGTWVMLPSDGSITDTPPLMSVATHTLPAPSMASESSSW